MSPNLKIKTILKSTQGRRQGIKLRAKALSSIPSIEKDRRGDKVEERLFPDKSSRSEV